MASIRTYNGEWLEAPDGFLSLLMGEIWEELHFFGPMTSMEMANLVNRKQSTISRYLRKMNNWNLIDILLPDNESECQHAIYRAKPYTCLDVLAYRRDKKREADGAYRRRRLENPDTKAGKRVKSNHKPTVLG